MDFRGRMNQSSPRPSGTDASNDSFVQNTPTSSPPNKKPESFVSQKSSGAKFGSIIKIGFVIMLFAVAALLISTTSLIAFQGNKQMQAVNDKLYQAVFLNNGQVYFGKIADISGKTVDLRGIYYLQTSNASGSTTDTNSAPNVSLVKLGCELHAPTDRMIINTSQVLFWENITDNGKVAAAIKEYQTKNNGKLNCESASQNSTQQAPSTSSNTGATPGTGTTNTTNNTTKKP